MKLLTLLAFSCLVLIALPLSVLAFEPGDEVAVISTELGLRTGEDTILDTELGQVYTVREAGEQSLVVGDGDIRGELLVKDVVLFEQAHEHFESLLEEAQDSADYHAAMARLFEYSEDYSEAEDHYSQAVELDAENPARYIDRGTYYHEQFDLDYAIRDFNRALRLNGDEAQVYLLRGNSLNEIGDIQAALDDFSKALELDDQLTDAYLSRGWTKYWEVTYAAGFEDFERAVECDPTSMPALYAVAWVAATCPSEELHDGERALELALQILELVEEPVAFDYELLAAAYARTGDFEKAIEYQERAIELDQESEYPYEEFQVQLAQYQKGEPFREPTLEEYEQRSQEEDETYDDLDEEPWRQDEPAEGPDSGSNE